MMDVCSPLSPLFSRARIRLRQASCATRSYRSLEVRAIRSPTPRWRRSRQWSPLPWGEGQARGPARRGARHRLRDAEAPAQPVRAKPEADRDAAPRCTDRVNDRSRCRNLLSCARAAPAGIGGSREVARRKLRPAGWGTSRSSSPAATRQQARPPDQRGCAAVRPDPLPQRRMRPGSGRLGKIANAGVRLIHAPAPRRDDLEEAASWERL